MVVSMNDGMQPYIISHAQNREDIIISGFFPGVENGVYIDIGANDPNADSVTRFFYDKGWSGINVEPIRRLFERLETARPRDTNLNLGISSKPGKLRFREYHTYHGLSTFDDAIKKEYDAREGDEGLKDFEEYDVKLMRLDELIKKHAAKKTINFLKVDVEGYEYEVLDSNDWNLYRPQVICIEANHISKDWRPLLLENNYEKIFFDGLNDYYVDKATNVGKQFSYIQAMLPTPIVDYRVVNIIEHYKKARLNADAKNVQILNELYRTRHELHVVSEELERLGRLKGLVKGLAKKSNSIAEELIYPSRLRQAAKPDKSEGVFRTPFSSSEDIADIQSSIRSYDRANTKRLTPKAHPIRRNAHMLYRKGVVRGAKYSVKRTVGGLKKLKQRGTR